MQEPVKVVRQKPKQRKSTELPRRTDKAKIDKYKPPELQEDISRSESSVMHQLFHKTIKYKNVDKHKITCKDIKITLCKIVLLLNVQRI